MTEKVLAAVDTTGRSDGDALVWDAADNVHKYQALAGISSAVLANEFRNFPSLEGADGTQPEWWEELDANATLTEEDVAGESITETWERCLKLVTTAASKYAYQRFTYADEPRLKSGRTVSVRVAVWAVGGASARVRIRSSVGQLGVSANTTAAAWTILTVEGEVLDGTYVQVDLEVDSGTAYFVPLAFGVGDTAPYELAPRALRQRASFVDYQTLRTLTGTSGEAGFGSQDLTSLTSPLAVYALMGVNLDDATATDQFVYRVRNTGSSSTGGGTERAQVYGNLARRSYGTWEQWLTDTQTFDDQILRSAGSGTLGFGAVYVHGWREWA